MQGMLLCATQFRYKHIPCIATKVAYTTVTSYLKGPNKQSMTYWCSTDEVTGTSKK